MAQTDAERIVRQEKILEQRLKLKGFDDSQIKAWMELHRAQEKVTKSTRSLTGTFKGVDISLDHFIDTSDMLDDTFGNLDFAWKKGLKSVEGLIPASKDLDVMFNVISSAAQGGAPGAVVAMFTGILSFMDQTAKKAEKLAREEEARQRRIDIEAARGRGITAALEIVAPEYLKEQKAKALEPLEEFYLSLSGDVVERTRDFFRTMARVGQEMPEDPTGSLSINFMAPFLAKFTSDMLAQGDEFYRGTSTFFGGKRYPWQSPETFGGLVPAGASLTYDQYKALEASREKAQQDFTKWFKSWREEILQTFGSDVDLTDLGLELYDLSDTFSSLRDSAKEAKDATNALTDAEKRATRMKYDAQEIEARTTLAEQFRGAGGVGGEAYSQRAFYKAFQRTLQGIQASEALALRRPSKGKTSTTTTGTAAGTSELGDFNLVAALSGLSEGSGVGSLVNVSALTPTDVPASSVIALNASTLEELGITRWDQMINFVGEIAQIGKDGSKPWSHALKMKQAKLSDFDVT